jgi:predicted phage terminase large subunit-like protein
MDADRANARAEWAVGTQDFAEKFRHFRLATPWFHKLWYSAFDDPTRSHIYVQAAREHAKTSCVLTYALHRLCENHHTRIGIISGSDPLAMAFLRELKHELESNQDLIRVYGDSKPFVGAKWTEHELVLRDAHEGPDGISGKDVSVFSVGRGTQISSRHCDVLIADDVESADSVRSEAVRQTTREWWAREVGPVLSPGGKFLVSGTRKSYDDLYSHLMGDPTWTVLDAAKSAVDEAGDPIWPEMWDKPALLKRKAQLDSQDVLAWPQEYLNEPLPSETQMFHPELWPVYYEDPWEKAAGLTVLQYWDLAISEKTTADFTVGFCIGVDDKNDIYLLERRRGHWTFNMTLDQIGAMGHAWPNVSRVGIEQVSYQAAAVQEALRRTMLPIVPIVPDKDKVTRARLLEARANAGKVVRPGVCPWWAEFSTEAMYFPAGSHDDQVDALSGAALMAGWSADAVSFAYGVWTCKNPDCQHMYVWEAGRACPKCGTKAPEEFENPEMIGGRLLEDQAMDAGAIVREPVTVSEPVAPPTPKPSLLGVAYEVEVVLGDPTYSVSLRHAVEQMGDQVEEREGRYFVATRRPGPTRTALAQLPYVQSVV